MASSPSCFLEGVFPKGNGSLTQAVTGTLQKIDKLFGGNNELLTAQRGALALGTSMIMASDQALAAQKVSLQDRQLIGAKASSELNAAIGSLSTASLGLALDPGAMQLLIAKTAAGSVNKGAMIASVAIAKEASDSGAPRNTKDVANWVGWAGGAITKGAEGSVSDMSAAQKAALMKAQAMETLKASGDLGGDGVALVAGAMAKHMIKNLQDGPGKGADAAAMQAMVGGAVGGAVAGIPSTVTGSALGGVILGATQNAALGLKGVGSDADRIKMFGEIGGSAIAALGADLKVGKSEFAAFASKAVSGPMMELNSVVSDIGVAKGAVAALTGPAVKQAAQYVDATKLGDMAGKITSAAVSGMAEVASDFGVSASTVMSSGLLGSAMSGAVSGLMTAPGVKVSNALGQLDEMTKQTASVLDNGGFTGDAGGAMKSMMSGATLGMAGVMSSAQMSTAMISLCKGAAQGSTDLLRSGVSMSSLMTAMVSGAASSADDAGVSDSTSMQSLMSNIVKGASMGASDLQTDGLFSASALASAMASATTAGLGAMKEMTTIFSASDVTGYADDLYGAGMNGAAMSGFAIGGIQAAMKAAMSSQSADYGLSFDVSGAAFTTADTKADALQSAISGGTVVNCFPQFSDDISDAALATAFTAALAANPSGDTTSFICRNNIGLCPGFRPAVSELGGSDVLFADMGDYCEGHKLMPYSPPTLTLCSDVPEPAMEDDIMEIYDPFFNQIRCEKDTESCPTVDVSVTEGEALNWQVISQNFGGETTEICAFTVPDHSNEGGGGDPGDTPACPSTFTITEDNVTKFFSAGGYRNYDGVICKRTAGAACPSVSPVISGVSMKRWSLSYGRYDGQGENISGDSCVLVGDYEQAFMTLSGVAIESGSQINKTNATPTSVTFNTAVGGSDAGIIYSCFFDRKVDGIVNATAVGHNASICSSNALGGTAFNFDTTTGVFTWTPPDKPGGWEFKIVAKNVSSGERGAQIYVVENYPKIPVGNLFAYYDALYASSYQSNAFFGPALNSATYMFNLASSLGPTPYGGLTAGGTFHAALTSFGGGYAGWTGYEDPSAMGGHEYTYQLRFDGAYGTFANLGTVMQAATANNSGYQDMMMEGWFNFDSMSGGSDYRAIMGNPNTSGSYEGFRLVQMPQASAGDYELRLAYWIGGKPPYEYEVREANPVAYYNFDRVIHVGNDMIIPNEANSRNGHWNDPGFLGIKVANLSEYSNWVAGPFGTANNRKVLTRNVPSPVSPPLTIESNPALEPANCPMTWEMWVWVGSAPPTGPLAGNFHNYAGNEYGWEVSLSSGRMLRLKLGDGSGTAMLFSSTEVLPSSSWSYVAITCTEISGPVRASVQFHINPSSSTPTSSATEGAQAYTALSYWSSEPVTINNNAQSVSYKYISELAIYGAVIPGSTLYDHYQARANASIVSAGLPGGWHHLGLGYQDSTNDVAYLYVDGPLSNNRGGQVTLINSGISSTPLGSATNTESLYVGCSPHLISHMFCWTGGWGDLRLYKGYNPSPILDSASNNMSYTAARYLEAPRMDFVNPVAMWLSASSLQGTSGSGIEGWNSIGAQSGVTQSTASKQPVKASGKFKNSFMSTGAGASFDGVNDYMTGHYEVTPNYRTFVLAVRFPANAAATGTIFRETDDSMSMLGTMLKRTAAGAMIFEANGNACTIPGALATRDKPYIIFVSFGNTSRELRIDGVAKGAGDGFDSSCSTGGAVPAYKNLILGADDFSGNLPLAMDVSDVLVYTNHLTTPSRITEIEGFLADKLRITEYP